jgi:hypothetical protein
VVDFIVLYFTFLGFWKDGFMCNINVDVGQNMGAGGV